MGQLIVRESSDFSLSSADSELDQQHGDNMDFVRSMTSSRKLVDKRFINLYLLRKAHQHKTYFGFDNESLINRPTGAAES